MREDEHAHRLRGLDEAGGGDRLPGGRGVAEAEAPDRARVLSRRVGSRRPPPRPSPRPGRAPPRSLPPRPALLELHGVPVAVAVPVLGFVLVPGDQLGEHPGERVDLVAAELRSRREPGRAVGQHALEAEHERVVHLPLGRRGAPAGVHLERVQRRAHAAVRGPRRARQRRFRRGGGRTPLTTPPRGGRLPSRRPFPPTGQSDGRIASCMDAAQLRCPNQRVCASNLAPALTSYRIQGAAGL